MDMDARQKKGANYRIQVRTTLILRAHSVRYYVSYFEVF